MSTLDIAVSSWALHRTLGIATKNAPDYDVFDTFPVGPTSLELLKLPGELRMRGFNRAELCHFHIPSKSRDYLEELRAAFASSNVVLQTLLIDNGDITDPVHHDRDQRWIAGWIEVAEWLGAEGARVIAGKQPWSQDAADLSVKNLKFLASLGPRVRIENWFDLLTTPDHVHEILERTEGQVGLCVDLGNWTNPLKYERLEAIAGSAETCHAKCEFIGESKIDVDDFAQSLAACENAGYSGPFTIVYCGVGETDWPAIQLQSDFLKEWFVGSTTPRP
jgi:hypothetical protein